MRMIKPLMNTKTMIENLILEFKNSIGKEFTIGGPLTLWRDENKKPWPPNHIWDTILEIKNGIVIGKFMEAPVDICRLKNKKAECV